MAIVASISRLAGTLIDLLQTRLELATVELEEGTLRLFAYLLLALVALFCLAMTLLLSIVLVIVIFWDTHRIPVLVSLMAAFSVIGILIGLGIRSNYRRKPKILAYTLLELRKDIVRLKPEQSNDGNVAP
ncbi:MAG: phage holin family protein [Burkholderiaceae bacterium]